MKKSVLKIICIFICVLILLCSCGSYRAFMSIESGDFGRWSQKYDYLDGTKSHILNLGKEERNMEIDVVTESGEIDIIISRIGKEKVLEIEDAETGKYYFSSEGWVIVKIDADEHRGSISVKKADS